MRKEVACCFRCCLLTWINLLGLEANERHWRRRGVDHFISQGAGGRRHDDAPLLPAFTMSLEHVLQPRFAISRFAHFAAIESRDLDGLNSTTPHSLLRSSRYRVPHTSFKRANGTLVVLNRWGHSLDLLHHISETLPAGPVALLYGDDTDWTRKELEEMRRSFSSERPLVRHMAINVDQDATHLPHVLQVRMGTWAIGLQLEAQSPINVHVQP